MAAVAVFMHCIKQYDPFNSFCCFGEWKRGGVGVEVRYGGGKAKRGRRARLENGEVCDAQCRDTQQARRTTAVKCHCTCVGWVCVQGQRRVSESASSRARDAPPDLPHPIDQMPSDKSFSSLQRATLKRKKVQHHSLMCNQQYCIRLAGLGPCTTDFSQQRRHESAQSAFKP